MTGQAWTSLFDLSGRRAVVIGAGNGIGEAVVCGPVAFGANVTCAEIDRPAAEGTAATIAVDGGTA